MLNKLNQVRCSLLWASKIKLKPILSYWVSILLVLAGLGCDGGGVVKEVLSEHPLDEVPIGCVARRVDEYRWEVTCEDMSQGGLADDHHVTDLETPAVPSDLGVLSDLSLQDPDRGDITSDMIPSGLDQEILHDMERRDSSLPTPCDPPLMISSHASAARPLSLIPLSASGGSGAWRFELRESNSGAIINTETGAYLAGSEVGTEDSIRLTDLHCIGEVIFTIRVVEGLHIAPRDATLQRGDQIDVEVTGGSGDFELNLINAASGGQLLDEDTYQAGGGTGLDLIEARDLQTGEVISVAFTVAASAPIHVAPAVTAFPVGAHATLTPEGGSRYYDVLVAPPLVADGLTLRSSEATSQQVTVIDKFTGRTASVQVDVIESLSADIPPQNDGFNLTMIRAQYDLDGDGIRDAIIGQAQADVEAMNGGGIFVFLSTDAGAELYPKRPSQVFAGVGRRYEIGRGFAVADLNADGYQDLVYGARGADQGARDSGALYIHFGTEGGRFNDEPAHILSSGQGDDHLGSNVAICDVNGDGWLDVIGSAIYYEDRRQDPIYWNEGALFVYLGGESGLPPSPDQVIRGQYQNTPDTLSGFAHLNYGYSLAAADFNGDGYCDVATSAISWQQQARGSVYIHAGRPSDEWSLGGLYEDPVMVIESDEPLDQSGQLGRHLVAGDLTGDGLGDLAISHHTADRNGTNAGAVHVFYGGGVMNWDETHGDISHFMSPYQAEWTTEGSPWDSLSSDLSILDYDGQPPLDLVLMTMHGDSLNGWDSGVLRVYTGGESGLGEHVR